MARTLYSGPYAEIVADDSTRIVTFRRTAVPLPVKQPIDPFFVQLEEVMKDKLGDRMHWRLMIDVREAPSRNDPQYEEAFKRHRPRIFGGFERRAVLVKSAVGLLQVNRLARAAGIEENTFHDETEARAWLLTGKTRSDRP
jgi:hypothetical protein